MRLTIVGFLLVALSALTTMTWAKDSDCWEKTGQASLTACSNIINSERVFGKRSSNSNLAIMYYNRGNAYGHMGQHDCAIADFNRALELNPKYARAYNNRGIAYGAKGEFERAIADHDQAIKQNPRFAKARTDRAKAIKAKGEFDSANVDKSQSGILLKRPPPAVATLCAEPHLRSIVWAKPPVVAVRRFQMDFSSGPIAPYWPAQCHNPRQAKSTAKIAPASLRQMIGQIVIAGFHGNSANSAGFKVALDRIAAGELGGLVFYGHNIRSRGNLVEMTRRAHALSVFAPPIVAVDQEGGRIARLGPRVGVKRVPSAAFLGHVRMPPAAVQRVYAAMAHAMAGLGFNFNFGPVVDVNRNGANPVIARLGRSYSADPQVVVMYAAAFVAAHRKYGIATSLKHFPGHGSSWGDSHFGPVDIAATWASDELTPFVKLIATCHADSVMVGHLKLGARGQPASLDAKMIGNVIRQDLKYAGLVITDDLRMGALAAFGDVAKRAEAAIRAGNDLLIISSQKGDDPMVVSRFLAALEAVAAADPVFNRQIHTAFARVVAFRRTLSTFYAVGTPID